MADDHLVASLENKNGFPYSRVCDLCDAMHPAGIDTIRHNLTATNARPVRPAPFCSRSLAVVQQLK
jgi:hypothetical protein